MREVLRTGCNKAPRNPDGGMKHPETVVLSDDGSEVDSECWAQPGRSLVQQLVTTVVLLCPLSLRGLVLSERAATGTLDLRTVSLPSVGQ